MDSIYWSQKRWDEGCDKAVMGYETTEPVVSSRLAEFALHISGYKIARRFNYRNIASLLG